MRSRQDFEDYARDVTPGLLRRARLLCRDEHRAEDLVQESLARLYRGRRRIDEGRNPTGYAHTVLFNVFLEQARRRSSAELALADPVPPPSPDPTDEVDRRLLLEAALQRLGELERMAVVARYLDDRPVKEVAQLSGRSEAWVRTTCHRALERMRPYATATEEALR